MERNFKEAIQHRRSYYALSHKSPVADSRIEEIVHFAVKHIPSAFNSQSSRLVLLLGHHHDRLWQIVEQTLEKTVPAEAFVRTKVKIKDSFASGYGTVLFFEDSSVISELQTKFPLYAHTFPAWSQQTSAMHQLAVWTMLEDVGFGASLQHYNPLIDEAVRKEWHLPDQWQLIAQMPFGTPITEPDKKEFQPVEDRIKIFK